MSEQQQKTHSIKKSDFSTEEWDGLLNAPFMVFYAVAAADGKVDEKEANSFIKAISQAQSYKSILLQQVLVETADNISSFLEKIQAGHYSFLEELNKVREVVESKLTAEDAHMFKLSLLGIGKEIAEASGGFLGFGNKISPQEQESLAAIAMALSIDL